MRSHLLSVPVPPLGPGTAPWTHCTTPPPAAEAQSTAHHIALQIPLERKSALSMWALACGSPWTYKAGKPDMTGWSRHWHLSCGGATAVGHDLNREVITKRVHHPLDRQALPCSTWFLVLRVSNWCRQRDGQPLLLAGMKQPPALCSTCQSAEHKGRKSLHYLTLSGTAPSTGQDLVHPFRVPWLPKWEMNQQ